MQDVHLGLDISSILKGKASEDTQTLAEKRPIFFYCSRKLMAARFGKFKGHFWTWKDRGFGSMDVSFFFQVLFTYALKQNFWRKPTSFLRKVK